MKKARLFIFLSLLLVIVGCGNSNGSTNNTNVSEEQEKKELVKYKETVKNFKLIEGKSLLESNGNEKKFIYFGRGTCPDCREFVPKLKKVSEKLNIEINYLDTDNITEDVGDQIIKKYNVFMVPTLTYVSENNDYSNFNQSKDDIEKWIKKQLE
ncbi:thioredoxin family protein [Enterococcus faecalis]